MSRQTMITFDEIWLRFVPVGTAVSTPNLLLYTIEEHHGRVALVRTLELVRPRR